MIEMKIIPQGGVTAATHVIKYNLISLIDVN
uniref:Uncharacterized protein n=1 Tax=Tetranychus urticae TaxID=32264 RepID=T1JQ93_TETUR